MTSTFIVNTSPLILLARTGHLHLLKGLSDKVLVPKAVLQEVQAGRRYDPSVERIESFEFQLLNDAPIPIEITGTLGIVLKSRQRDLIPSARDLITQLEKCGMRLSTNLREAALSKVGE